MNTASKDLSNPRLNAITFRMAIFWSILILGLVCLSYCQLYYATIEVARSAAYDAYNKDLVYRHWAAGHGGVYVPITPATPPNPYLADIPERDIRTPSGKKLTLINPAYMTRQIHELGKKDYGVQGHITSLRPIRPQNVPDEWERKALQAFEQGKKEVVSLEPLGNETYLRFMRPLNTEIGCLKCHKKDAYKVGDIRGGISVSIPWATSRKALLSEFLVIILGYGLIWIVGIIALYIVRKRFQNHLVERKRVVQILQDSDERSDIAQRAANMGIWTHDLVTDQLTWSPIMFDLFGLDPLQGAPSFELWESTIVNEDRDEIGSSIAQSLQLNAPMNNEYRIVLPTGQLRWINSQGKGQYDNQGRPIRMSGICIDITDRKLAEEKLHKCEELFKAITAHNPDHLIVQDRDLKYSFVLNPQLGLTERDMIGKTDHDFLSKEDADKITVFKRQILKTGSPMHVETPLLDVKGEQQFFDGYYVPKLDMTGHVDGLIGYFRNVTESKRMQDELLEVHRDLEQKVIERTMELSKINEKMMTEIMERMKSETALKKSEEKYRSIFDNAVEGIYQTTSDGKYLSANPAYVRMLGYASQEEMIASVTSIKEQLYVHPFDRDKWREILDTHGFIENFETQFYKKDGSIIWVSTNARAVKDEEGNLLYYEGTVEDITRHKKAEEALQESQELFRKTLDLGVVGMATTHPYTYYFLSANKHLCEMIGYTEEELLQKTWVEITFPKEKVDEDSVNLANLLSGELNGYVMEKQYQHKDGHMIDITLSVQGVRKIDGTIDYILILIDDITERKLTENNIRRLNERILIATNSARVGIWDWDVINDLLVWDDQLYSLYGLKKEDFSGAYEAWVKGLHPDDRAPGDAIVKQALQSEKNYESEFRVIWPDGTIHFLAATGNIIRDADGKPLRMIGVNYDITDSKLAEKELTKHREHLEEIVAERTMELQQMTERMTLAAQAGGVGIWDYDTVNNILTWDDQMFTLYGIIPDQFSGAYEAWQAGLHPEDRQRGEEEIRLALSGEKEFNTEFRVVWPDGTIRHIRALAIVQRDAAGLPQHMIGTNWDITESNNLHEQLDYSKKAAESANRAKSAFVANMSHEIRTPMNAIMGFAQVLERDPSLTPQQADHIRTIHRSTEHLLRLINDILDISKIEAGHTSLNESVFSLHGLLEDMELMFTARTSGKGLQLLVERDDSVPRCVTADEGKLRQVLVNLLGNAVKFTVTGGIAVRIRAKAVEEKIRKDEEYLRLEVEVEDTGVGIPREEMERIFDPFHQGDAGVIAGGTGLGLDICRRVVEMMGGKITVTSQVGKGSCFRFSVLMKPAEDVAQQEKRARRRIIGLVPGTEPFRILAVDDMPDNRALLCALLKPLGFEVAEAANGVEALDVFAKWSPHVVLMDMRMPIMDGYEATRRIKATKAGKTTPIIATTASAFEDAKEKVMDTGVCAYVRKPFRMEELCEELGKCLDLRYIYADEATAAPDHLKAVPLTEEAMAALPAEMITAMRQAVEEGNMTRLTELIAQVEKLDSPTASGLQALADRYDYEKLSKWLEKGEMNNG